MLYRNTQNGIIQDFSCTISSKTWEPVETPAPVVVTDEKEAPEKPQKKKKVVE